MLRFCANLSLLFTEVPLLERFERAREAGFAAVEIQFPYELSIDALHDQLRRHQLRLVLINVPAGDLMQGGCGLAGVPGQEQAFQHALLEAVAYARALRVPTLNVLAGRQPADADLIPCLHTLHHNLLTTVQECALHGLQPVIEAINGTDMPGFLIQNLAQMQQMLEQPGLQTLQMQYDCYHMAMMGENVLAGLQANLPRIGHIQFADWPGRQEPGTGLIEFEKIFAWLQQSGYAGHIGAEYRPSRPTPQTLDWLAFQS